MILVWTVSAVFLLAFCIFLLLQVPRVQEMVKNTAVHYLSRKLQTKVQLDRLSIDFPNSVALDGLYIADRRGDTLVYSDSLYVGIDILGLLSGRIKIEKVSLDYFSAYVYRTLPDTAFNFDFITRAFASEPDAEADTAAGPPPRITVHDIALSRIHIRYKDDVTGYDADVNLGKFKTRFNIFNLDSLHFSLDSLLLSGLRADITQAAPLVKDTASSALAAGSTALPALSLRALALNNIFVHYNNKAAGMSGILNLGDFEVVPRKIDLDRQFIDVSSLSLNNTHVVFSRYAGTEPVVAGAEPEKTDTASGNWIVKLDKLRLAGDDLKYDDAREPATAQGIDYHHLDVRGLTVDVDDAFYSADSSHATIRNIALREKNGFDLKKLTADATYTSHGAELARLDLETPGTRIAKYLAISYPSLDAIGDDPGSLGIRADLSGCVVDLKDVLYFQPSLDSAPSMRKLMHAVVKLQGQIQGKLNDLDIKGLGLQTARQTVLALDARVTGLPDMDQAVFNVNLKNFSTAKNDLDALLPAGTVPSSVNIPARMALKGTYKGSLNTFATQLLLESTDGNLAVNGQVRDLDDSLHASYHALVKTGHLDLGKLLKNDTLYGPVTLAATIEGQGLTRDGADAALKGAIRQARLKGYNYQNLTFAGDYKKQAGQLSMQLQDPNLRFSLASSADLSGRYPAVKINLDVDSADLQALHFSTDTLKFRGKMKADFPAADIDHLNGKLLLSDLQMVKSDRRMDVDTITLEALANDTIDSLHLEAPFADAAVYGHYQLSKAGALVQSLLQHYFGSDSAARAVADSAGKQDMHIRLTLLDHPVWQQMMPSLRRFSGASFSGELSSDPRKIQLRGNIPQVVLGELRVDSLRLGLRSDTGRLRYGLVVNAVRDGSLQVHKTILTGDAAHHKITTDLKVHDASGKNKYHLAGLLSLDGGAYKFHFNPDSLLLNYRRWQTPADNYIVYEKKGITAHNLRLENNGQYVLINSPQGSPASPLEVSFHDFSLETLTRIISSDTALAGGTLNGKAVGEDLLDNPLFTADMHIDSFTLRNQPVGNVALKVNNKTANAYTVDMTLTGDSNDLRVTGAYYTRPESRFDLNVSIPALNLASAQAFTFGQVKDASGMLAGNLHLQGTTEQPRVNGSLAFRHAALTIAKVNDYIRMPDEHIQFDDRGIHFDHFTIIDSLNNKASVDGDVLTSDFRHYRFALDLKARNFRALNAKRSQDEFYYGPVYIDADIRVRGDEHLPKVDGNLRLDRKSVLTVVLPGSTPAVESHEGIVEFVDAAHMRDTVQLGLAADTIQHAALTGIQLSANVSVDTAAVLNLIIDPVNGDNLRVRGNATLNLTMDPSGKISLTGRYEIAEGAYSMSLERLIRRKFDIKKGSTITWTGDPTSADLDLTAIYHVETSAMELVEDQLTNVSETTRNTYKQKLPFEVYLNIKGELMKPDISFSLDMPESSRNAFDGSVYTRINQINTNESEVNKQVLGLLVLGHFIADNPFESAGGGGAAQMARQSASKILSQQLNNLAGSLIKGVDINFDLQSSEDYSTGEAENKTNLNVGVSKSLFNGRTTVYVGSNIQLEGPQQADQRSSQIAGDVTIEYKLSRDGRYRLRAYRQNKYQEVIQGQFIETGLSFIIVMDYNHFRELFHKRTRHRRNAGGS